METRTHTLQLVFESFDAAWQAVAAPFAAQPVARVRYEEMLATHSPAPGRLSMQDNWQILLAPSGELHKTLTASGGPGLPLRPANEKESATS